MSSYENEFSFLTDDEDPMMKMAWETVCDYLGQEMERPKTLVVNPPVFMKVARLVSVLKKLDDGMNGLTIKVSPSDVFKNVEIIASYEDGTFAKSKDIQEFADAIKDCSQIVNCKAFKENFITLSFYFKDYFIEVDPQ